MAKIIREIQLTNEEILAMKLAQKVLEDVYDTLGDYRDVLVDFENSDYILELLEAAERFII